MKLKPFCAVIALTTFLAGCGEVSEKKATSSAPLVVTERVMAVDFQPSKSYIGRIEAIEDTNIIAQVSGYLQAHHFNEGQMVKKGQLLYTIEPSTFQAQVSSSKAALTQAKAGLKKAQLDHQRGKSLLPRGSISQSEFDALTATLLGAQAALEAAEAQLKIAQVNLSYTQIRAPFSGRISDTKVSTGDLVSPSSGVLTTLVSLDPVHTTFNVSERERLSLEIDRIKGDGSTDSNRVEVQLELENGQSFAHLGQIDFLGNRINVQTGTIAMRAIVPNPEHQLLPGQHITIQLRDKQSKQVIVVPRKAVQTDLEGNFVMVLTKGDIAERRNVELGPQLKQGIIIHEGLNKDDVIITQGLQRIRNGIEVRIQILASAKQ
ncbi:efflux transporter periplasmic adaptor subunit [Vibrio azureus]|uniref:Putative efflux pump periplasmic linker protein n=1 Tax=Vibrio azureus NBRC 104587 TaxID=1219077 RepID=U3CHJ7_9VIBR|nr:efflux RND transporter periplasmic adaptor subunit [Vibrio azureus]AUI88351.1 efflux transporter periplasmic adaptor subunit [Vibrio azureus]GAD77723.1 putative efflux pump periplasmic linker protein [Vibrio azureus NBRC 104587]